MSAINISKYEERLNSIEKTIREEGSLTEEERNGLSGEINHLIMYLEALKVIIVDKSKSLPLKGGDQQ